MIGLNSRLCLTIIPSLALGPLACFLYAMQRRNRATRSCLRGPAASGIAATFYAATCDDDSPLFVMIWYPTAVDLVITVGWLIGGKILRW